MLIIEHLTVILACLFISCDSGELETANDKFGSLAFQVEWNTADTSSASSDNTDQMAAPTELDCEEAGVFWVNMIVYNSSNQYLTESEQWPCGAHAGTLSNIPTGSGLKIVIFGKNAANEILYRGYKSNINVSENQVTDTGLIEMYYFIPTGGNDSNCDTTVNHSWQAVQSATSYEFQMATDVFFTNIDGSMTVKSPETGCIPIPDSTGHFWRVRAVDFDGLKSAWSEIWLYGTRPEPPDDTPPAPTGGNVVYCPNEDYRFQWDPVSSAAYYEFQVSIPVGTSDFTDVEQRYVVIPQTECMYLYPGGTAYWRVRTIGLNGLISDWSYWEDEV